MKEENLYQAPDSDLGIPEQDETRYAGFWIRVVASIIDTLLIAVVTLPILVSIYGTEYWSESFAGGVWDVLISYIFPAVAIILFWIYKSATPGKMLLGLEVDNLGESSKLSVGQSIGRYVAYFPSMLILFLGVIWVAFDKRKQGLHDKLANTAVIKK